MNQQFLSNILSALSDESKWILFDDLQYQPEVKLYQLITQLEAEVLRPKMTKLKEAGKDHSSDATYIFFSNIKNAIFQAAEAAYIIDELRTRLEATRQLNDYLLQQNAILQNKLSLYENVEQLTANQLLQTTIDRVREKMAREYLNTRTVTKQTT